jgi:hypothetical protein
MAIFSTWWTVLFVDPPARLVRARGPASRFWLASYGLILGLTAAVFFALPLTASIRGGAGMGPHVDPNTAPVGAALLYYVSTVLERAAGRDWPDELRTWLAGAFGPLRDLCCALTLTLGRYLPTHRAGYVYLGIEILCLELIRYHRVDAYRPVPPPEPDEDFVWWDWYCWADRLSMLLVEHRMDTRLVGGAEFRMAVFILAPLAAFFEPQATVPLTVVAGMLLVVGEFRERRKPWLLAHEAAPASAATMPIPAVPAARPEPAEPRKPADTKTMSKVGSR